MNKTFLRESEKLKNSFPSPPLWAVPRRVAVPRLSEGDDLAADLTGEREVVR